jgi:hypothetical protein
MGGAYPGTLPPKIRLAVIVQAILVAATAGLTISVAGLAPPEWSSAPRWSAWVVVAFSAVCVVLNAITPSAGERRIWLPVTLVMCGSSLVVAVTAA